MSVHSQMTVVQILYVTTLLDRTNVIALWDLLQTLASRMTWIRFVSVRKLVCRTAIRVGAQNCTFCPSRTQDEFSLVPVIMTVFNIKGTVPRILAKFRNKKMATKLSEIKR